jgi:hypothetical protein
MTKQPYDHKHILDQFNQLIRNIFDEMNVECHGLSIEVHDEDSYALAVARTKAIRKLGRKWKLEQKQQKRETKQRKQAQTIGCNVV